MRAARRTNPLLPWAAGAVLSLVVLALTLVDESWLDRLLRLSPLSPEAPAVTMTLDRAEPVAPESADAAEVLERAAPAAPESPDAAMPPERTAPPTPAVANRAPEAGLAPNAKSPPKIVPISPEGRGTARLEPRPQPRGVQQAPAQDRSTVPALPDASAPRVVPISLERPQAPLSPGVQLVGTVVAERAARADLADVRQSAADAPAGSEPTGVRLFIHYSAVQAGDAATATRLAEYLRRRGFEVAGIRPVEFLIERPGVRFFFERDHAESERLLEDLGWFFRGLPRQAPERASDFTHYTPKPQPGTVEIWLPTTS